MPGHGVGRGRVPGTSSPRLAAGDLGTAWEVKTRSTRAKLGDRSCLDGFPLLRGGQERVCLAADAPSLAPIADRVRTLLAPLLQLFAPAFPGQPAAVRIEADELDLTRVEAVDVALWSLDVDERQAGGDDAVGLTSVTGRVVDPNRFVRSQWGTPAAPQVRGHFDRFDQDGDEVTWLDIFSSNACRQLGWIGQRSHCVHGLVSLDESEVTVCSAWCPVADESARGYLMIEVRVGAHIGFLTSDIHTCDGCSVVACFSLPIGLRRVAI